jgi:hypothetical protein
MNRSVVLVAAVSICGFQPRGVGLEQLPRVTIERKVDPGCQFSLSADSIAPQILAAESIGVHVRLLAQPDSPVAVIGADLRHLTVTVGGSGFESHGTGPSTIEIRNISDRLLTRVDVAVRIRTNEGFVGNVVTTRLPIEPGGTARLELPRGGSGSGTALNDVAELLVFVDSVETSGCRYKPSQAWPIPISGK